MKPLDKLYILTLLFVVACAEQEDEVKVAEPTARVVYINASPTLARNVEVYTSKSVIYGGNNVKGNLSFGGVSSLNPTVSNATLRLRLARAAADLVNNDVELEGYNYYSAIVANTDPTATDTTASVGILFSNDEMTLPSAGHARMRFINLAVASPAIDLYVFPTAGVAATTPIFANKEYLQSSAETNVSVTAGQVSEMMPWGFMEIPVENGSSGAPAPIQYTFELRNSGELNTNPAKVSFKASLITGRFYTVIVRGIEDAPAGSSNILSIQVVEYPYPNY